MAINLPLFLAVDFRTWVAGAWDEQPAHAMIFWWRLGVTLILAGGLAMRRAAVLDALRHPRFAWFCVLFYPVCGVWFAVSCQSLVTDVSVYVLLIVGVASAPLPSPLKLLVYPGSWLLLAVGLQFTGDNDTQIYHLLINAGVAAVGAAMLDAFASRAHAASFVQSRLLERERQRSESVLGNILPPSVAQRLKDDPSAVVEYHPAVSILFADFVGFGTLSETLQPDEMVGLLDHLFLEFDEAADRFGVEKIKTTGDSYMAACGVPQAVADHARRIADLALRIQSVARRFRSDRGLPVHFRIGLHTGPAIAGVIGRRKFSYDLWGDTVNLSHHLQAYGEADRIHISMAMQQALAAEYRYEARPPMSLKGRAPMQTYFLLGFRRDVDGVAFTADADGSAGRYDLR